MNACDRLGSDSDDQFVPKILNHTIISEQLDRN